MTDLEAGIQIKTVTYLRGKGYTVFSVPNESFGKIRTRAGLSKISKLKAMGLLPGVSDLVVIGAFPDIWFIEMKKPGGRQSKNQKDFEKDLKNKGWKYLLFDNFDDILKNF